MYDTIIIGGGVSGMSCALVLGSALNKEFMAGKKIGIITHQKTSSLQEALFNNAYGIPAGTLGVDLLLNSKKQLSELYPQIEQICSEKVMKIEGTFPDFTVVTNKKILPNQICCCSHWLFQYFWHRWPDGICRTS